MLERIIWKDPTTNLQEGLLFNLCTIYELESSYSLQKKQKLLELVSKHRGDGFNISCLKIPWCYIQLQVSNLIVVQSNHIIRREQITWDASHLAKIFGLKFRKIFVSKGRAFSRRAKSIVFSSKHAISLVDQKWREKFLPCANGTLMSVSAGWNGKS